MSDYNHDDFEVIDMPGAPPMYSHEMAPQVPIPVVEIFRAMGQIYTPEADGAIDASVTAFDGDMMGALKGWLEPLGQPVYAMAPLALPMLKGSQKNDANVVNFLDKMCTQFGKRSLIYVSSNRDFDVINALRLLSVHLDILRNALRTSRAREIVDHDQYSDRDPDPIHFDSCFSAFPNY